LNLAHNTLETIGSKFGQFDGCLHGRDLLAFSHRARSDSVTTVNTAQQLILREMSFLQAVANQG
jgi:hypothetical protein